jgi:hypothetical protein
MELQYVPERSEPLSDKLAGAVLRAYDKAVKAFERETGRAPRKGTVYLTPDNKLDRVAVR